MTLVAKVPHRILVSVDSDTYQKLKQKSNEEGRSMSGFVYSVLKAHFGDDYKIKVPVKITTKHLNLRRNAKLKKRGA